MRKKKLNRFGKSHQTLFNLSPSSEMVLVEKFQTKLSTQRISEFDLFGFLYVHQDCRDLANYISINQPILHKYNKEDVSLGSWFIGLEVEHIDERSMCCGTPPDIVL